MAWKANIQFQKKFIPSFAYIIRAIWIFSEFRLSKSSWISNGNWNIWTVGVKIQREVLCRPSVDRQQLGADLPWEWSQCRQNCYMLLLKVLTLTKFSEYDIQNIDLFSWGSW